MRKSEDEKKRKGWEEIAGVDVFSRHETDEAKAHNRHPNLRNEVRTTEITPCPIEAHLKET